MKITSVQTYHLEHALPHLFGGATLFYSSRDTLLIKISTDEGLVGWGETAPLGAARAVIEEQLKPILIGQNPLDHRRLWRQLWGPNFGNGLAVGGVDIALHDLRGKAVNRSIADLYGGRLRDRVPAYASALSYIKGREAEQHYAEDATVLVERGFRAIKMRIGGQPVRRDLAAVTAVRAAVGPDIQLMADGNGAYTLPTALQVGRELERLDLYWFEEPLPQPHYAGYEVLTEKLDIALAGGEVLDSRGAFREVILRRALDIVQPDISLCGGFAECLFVAEMARLWGIQTMPHCYAGAILVAATLQLLALLPVASWAHTTETPLLELDVIDNPFRDRLAGHPFQVRDGLVDVPTGPGLGITIDEDLVRHYQRK